MSIRMPARRARPARWSAGRAFLATVLLVLLAATPARGQQATLRGFVTDASDGEPMALVNLTARMLPDGDISGTATSAEGAYVFARLRSGVYAVQATFIGYRAFRDTLELRPGEVRTVSIRMQPDASLLDEIVVQDEAQQGAARIVAGQQTIRPGEIELVPTPDVSGDLASYLTTLPGVVAMGDRGGQLFIRGGEPSQNLVLLDGITVFQPFHLLGFYSVFPSEIIGQTDVYAGGFSSAFGGRISSVIDVTSRSGNNRRFAGAAALSPFVSSLRIEGPLLRDRISFLASARRSVIEEGAGHYVDAPLPFAFGDLFAKVNIEPTRSSRIGVSTLRTFDRGTLAQATGGIPEEEIRWQNRGLGISYLILPRILPVLANFHASVSRVETELGPAGATTRSSSVEDLAFGVDATFYGDRVDFQWGLWSHFTTLKSELGGQFQNVQFSPGAMDNFAVYLDPEITIGRGLRIRPGVIMQGFYAKPFPFFEPRLRVVWQHGRHQISGATGLYYQELLGLTDRRDAASIFTAWANVPNRTVGTRNDPRAGRVPTALHVLLGYQARVAHWLDGSLEGYYKKLDNLFIPEWTAFPRLTTNLQPARGRVAGLDARIELRLSSLYAHVNYGLSHTTYEAHQPALELVFGEQTIRFRPPHDRRHQVNVLAGTSLYGFDLNVRWEFGSGLPFSRALGFDGFVHVQPQKDVRSVPPSRRVIYERPYNGVLPTYHRLDVSAERTFSFGGAAATVQASVINVYDRRNLLYLDVFTLRRADQLPFVPSLGVKLSFN